MKHWVILALGLSAASVSAVDTAVRSPVITSALLSALRFAAWPVGALEPDLFVLCYRGPEALDASLQPLAGVRVQGRAIELRRLDSPNRALACHALYLPAASTERDRYIEAVALRPVLTVGDDVAMLGLGGNLALLPAGGRLRPAVNTDAVQRSGLRVDARLLRVARRPLPPGPPR